MIRLLIPRQLLLALALLALSGTEEAAAAAPNAPYSSFSIRPTTGTTGFFVLKGAAGARLAGAFRIVNTGTKAGTALIYPVDATTGATSGAVYLDQKAPRRSVSYWVRLPIARVTLQPREAKIVRFSVLVPRKLRSGHHLGAIVAENRELTSGANPKPTEKRGGLQVRVRHLSIVAIQVNVPGPQTAQMKFRGVTVGTSSGYETLYLELRNSGNTLLRPRLKVQITNSTGRLVYNRTLKLDTFVPKTKIRYPLHILRRPLPAGKYTLAATLSYGQHTSRTSANFMISRRLVEQLPTPTTQQSAQAQPVHQQRSRSFLPWAITGIALLLGIVLGAVIVPKLRSPRSHTI